MATAWPKAGVDGWRDLGTGFLERAKPGARGVVERVTKDCPWTGRDAAPRRSRSSASTVELRAELPATPHRVHLSAGTVLAIEDEIREAFHAFGRRLETGGMLQGFYRAQLWPPRTLVTTATGPGSRAEHWRGEMRWFPNDVLDPDLFELGAWHTHPTADARPSDADLKCWRDSLGHSDAIAYVGLIATPRDDGAGWMSPKLTAWVTRRAYQGPYFCESALIVES